MKSPYDGINFTKRIAKIVSKKGKILLEKEVIFPDYFSDNSVNIVTDKYLCNSAKKEETKLTEMIDRVSETIADWGKEQNYFKDKNEYDEFLYYLKYFQIHQYCAFNSPVYFNIGLSNNPQLSACFILEINDDMESITETLKTESLIFKNGSGSGMNLSNLRGSNEKVNGGGTASGPVSFLKSQDVNAGVIRSGGTLRRSAKLACVNIDHPDIENFISCKNIEEKKLKILAQAGIKPYLGYDMTDHVFFQNTNLSVGIFDWFMEMVQIKDYSEMKRDFFLMNRLDNSHYKRMYAKELLMEIAKQAWTDGCPGLLFLDTMQKWNTCSNTSVFESTNPCGEYVGPNNTSCNLASINLLKFFSKGLETGTDYHGAEIGYENKVNFDFKTYEKVIQTMITAQDIIIDKASYPTKEIEKNTRDYRALGLGFSNLGATLMYLGVPYDSEKGRYIASMITSSMTSIAYLQSSKISRDLSYTNFARWNQNKDRMHEILELHQKMHIEKIKEKRNRFIPLWLTNLISQTSANWLILKDTIHMRNSQVTLIAPTGTISFLMGCDTFGIEPEFSLVKYKTLAGSGEAELKLENIVIRDAILNLGYSDTQCADILVNMDNLEETILNKEHLPIFDTAMKNGTRQLSSLAHINMMAAVQPFISGAISKTINLPEESTVEDVYNLYLEAYKKGLKGITIYRDNSKNSQPLNVKQVDQKIMGDIIKNKSTNNKPVRRKLPVTRKGKNHKFTIGTVSGYIKTGEYNDGTLGEVFLSVSKQGSTLSGLLDSVAIITSMGIQYGVPLFHMVRKMKDTRFDPSGITRNKDIRFAKSILDYVFKFLAYEYLTKEKLDELGLKIKTEKKKEKMQENKPKQDSSNPFCDRCGSIMFRIGSCFTCQICGNSTGVCG